ADLTADQQLEGAIGHALPLARIDRNETLRLARIEARAHWLTEGGQRPLWTCRDIQANGLLRTVVDPETLPAPDIDSAVAVQAEPAAGNLHLSRALHDEQHDFRFAEGDHGTGPRRSPYGTWTDAARPCSPSRSGARPGCPRCSAAACE